MPLLTATNQMLMDPLQGEPITDETIWVFEDDSELTFGEMKEEDVQDIIDSLPVNEQEVIEAIEEYLGCR